MANHELSVPEIADEVRGWVDVAQAVRSARGRVLKGEADAVGALKAATMEVAEDDEVPWQVLPLRPADVDRIKAVARRKLLPPMSKNLHSRLTELTGPIADATRAVGAVTGFKRFFAFGGRRHAGEQAAAQLVEYRNRYVNLDMSTMLRQVVPSEDPRVDALRVENVLDDWIGLPSRMGRKPASALLEPSNSFVVLPNAMKRIERAIQRETALRKTTLDAGNEVRRAETDRMLAEIPVERLRDATAGRIQVGALNSARITTVLDVIKHGRTLELVPGIGETSANRIRGAARTIRQSTYEEMPVRIDVNKRSAEHTKLLRCLREWDAVHKMFASSADSARMKGLAPLAHAIDANVTHALVFCSTQSTIEEFRESVRAVARCARRIADAEDGSQAGDPWDDFLSRPADYFSLLAELGFIVEDEEKTHGDLPEDIVNALRDFELKTEHLNVSLRGYQAFGARFALVQRKVIIGDEMGLGKTIEALAVLAHLRSMGQHHALVICPAAVVTNWLREIRSKSDLAAHRLHGIERAWSADSWVRRGGAAITTFETLPWLMNYGPSLPDLACIVVDEAHYIKNPAAQRTQRTAYIIDTCDRAILMTGTPLENRVDEFRNLVGYLRPDLVVDATEFAPKRFRRQVAPAYLRRNQEDVLTELPERVDVDEWLEMSVEDFATYRRAVEQGNFMAMRQAAMLQGQKSSKTQRLCEIVEEAEENGRRVVVFSYFLDVLDQVVAALPGNVFGPLTGRVPAVRRQMMIDEFSASPGGAVLVSQILAGGVGLNIQTASVVIICEPQLKPTTEWQAIARAHRMGQVHNVQVHRLLSDEGVDLRVYEILAEKIKLFHDFARDSETAESAPEAVDISEADLAREVIAAERERLFGQPAAARP